MNDQHRIKILGFLFKCSGKDYCFCQKSGSSYCYLDRDSEFIVVPVCSVETGKVEKLPPKVLFVTADYSIKEAKNVPNVVEKFFEYMGERNFSL